MMPNNDDFRNIYDNLTADNADTWDIYAGEDASAAAEEKGVPADKWEQDRVRMQMGHEIMTEILHEDLPEPASEEEKERLCSLISGLIDTRLVCLSDDTARKGMLLQAIVAGKAAAGQEVDEEELAAMGLLDVNTLKAQLVDLNFSYTMNRVCPVIEQQCQLLMATPEQTEEVLRNPGALAIAAYLAAAGTKEDAAGKTLSLQDMPEVAGAAAGLVEHIKFANTLDSVAYGLDAIAVVFSLISLLCLAEGAIFTMEQAAVIGLGAAITEILATCLPVLLIGCIAAALVCFGLERAATLKSERIRQNHIKSDSQSNNTTNHNNSIQANR